MKKFVSIVGIIVLICCLFGSVGCGNKYNAELFNNAEQWIRDDFLRENRVKAYYPNEIMMRTMSNPKDMFMMKLLP